MTHLPDQAGIRWHLVYDDGKGGGFVDRAEALPDREYPPRYDDADPVDWAIERLTDEGMVHQEGRRFIYGGPPAVSDAAEGHTYQTVGTLDDTWAQADVDRIAAAVSA